MEYFDVMLYLAVAAGFLMAFSLGANDVANSMAPVVGAKAITVKQAVIIAGVLNFAGATLLGSEVTQTVAGGIVDPDYINNAKVLAMGMFCCLLTAGLWVLISTLTGFPVSSTHSIIGGLIGFGVMAGGMDSITWSALTFIAITWVASPVLAGIVSALICLVIKKTILNRQKMLKAVRRWVPRWIFFTALLIILSFMYKTPFGERFSAQHVILSFGIIIAFPMATGFLGLYWIRKIFPQDEGCEEEVEVVFKRLQVFTAGYVALSQGANDVANAMGPVVALFLLARYHLMPPSPEIPVWILAMGGVGIMLGVAALGYKVIATVGSKITKLNNTKGFSVNFSVASSVLLASHLGVPVSTTTVAVGAVTGAGAADSIKSINYMMLLKIFMVWVITVPMAALSCAGIYWMLSSLFL